MVRERVKAHSPRNMFRRTGGLTTMAASKMRVFLAAAAALALAASAAAQAYKAPKNGFGQPDFSGTWTNASITQLERPPGLKDLVITPAQAKAMEGGYARMRNADAQPLDPKA